LQREAISSLSADCFIGTLLELFELSCTHIQQTKKKTILAVTSGIKLKDYASIDLNSLLASRRIHSCTICFFLLFLKRLNIMTDQWMN